VNIVDEWQILHLRKYYIFIAVDDVINSDVMPRPIHVLK